MITNLSQQERLLMGIKSFLGIVEIRTKIASVIPFLLGTIYAVYRFNKFDAVNFLLFFGALLFIDMTTTALNNYFDFKRANKKHGYNYEKHNTIVRDSLKESTVIALIGMLFIAATALGILLVVNTNLMVLLIGALSFLIGIMYSFGPVPISKTPFGELFSGFFMGFVIVFLSIYIHIYNQDIISLSIDNFDLNFHMSIIEIMYIFILSIPTMCGIANIMLANNICDIADDIENKRFTLPVYIGKKKSLLLFRSLYYAAFGAIIILVVLKLIPIVCLIILLTFIPVNKNIKLFNEKQSKKETFPLAVKNFLIMSLPLLLLFGLAYFIN
jgi:1,4-dihydroxy-2-naphthoate polyprenyltransferase